MTASSSRRRVRPAVFILILLTITLSVAPAATAWNIYGSMHTSQDLGFSDDEQAVSVMGTGTAPCHVHYPYASGGPFPCLLVVDYEISRTCSQDQCIYEVDLAVTLKGGLVDQDPGGYRLGAGSGACLESPCETFCWMTNPGHICEYEGTTVVDCPSEASGQRFVAAASGWYETEARSWQAFLESGGQIAPSHAAIWRVSEGC